MMVSQGLTDIDSLCLSVRDRESRRLISEAVTAYRGGAFRSAIMSTWIAVAYDIISKARELAAQGEAVPKAFVDELDSAIASSDIPRRQNIERQLLTTANERLQLLAPHEFEALSRLYSDRHLCAHPAFVADDELFQPTPEQVRTHIIHALQYLLVHAPLQGKSAVTRFEADVLSPSFPTSSQDIGAYVRSKYLDRAKDVLVSNLIKGLLTAPFGAERAKFVGKERLLAQTLREIAVAKTAIYDQVAPPFIAQRFNAVTDDVLLNICMFLEVDTRIWTWISEPVRIRVRTLLVSSPLADLKSSGAFDAFAIPELANVLMPRFDAFDEDAQIGVISENPRGEFVDRAIELYSGASSWRYAELLGRALMVRLAPFFSADDIKRVLDAVIDNGQIWAASGMPAILDTVFDLSRPVLPEAKTHWQGFVDAMTTLQHGDAAAHFAYPGIRAKLGAT
jgi:hypothetical protein